MDVVSGVRSIMALKENAEHDNQVPRFVKIIILAQAVVILSFTIGMYQEYVNNLFLQDYVLSLFRSNFVADVLLSMVTVSVFAIGTFTLLGSMSTTRREKRELEFMTQLDEEAPDLPTMPVLETLEPTPRARGTSRRRHRKSRIDSGDIYRSMVNYADDQRE
jgi:hypothetical protein